MCLPPKQAAVCEHGYLELDGISPAIAQQFYVLHTEADWRTVSLQCFYRTGKLPGDDEAKASATKEKVEQKIKEPLRDFPDDVEYFDGTQVGEQMEQSKFFDTIKKDRPEHFKWTQKRADACLGKSGKVAKRSSMNDILWGRYLWYKEQGSEMTLEMLEGLVRYEMLSQQMAAAGEDEAKVEELLDEIRRL